MKKNIFLFILIVILAIACVCALNYQKRQDEKMVKRLNESEASMTEQLEEQREKLHQVGREHIDTKFEEGN